MNTNEHGFLIGFSNSVFWILRSVFPILSFLTFSVKIRSHHNRQIPCRCHIEMRFARSSGTEPTQDVSGPPLTKRARTHFGFACDGSLLLSGHPPARVVFAGCHVAKRIWMTAFMDESRIQTRKCRSCTRRIPRPHLETTALAQGLLPPPQFSIAKPPYSENQQYDVPAIAPSSQSSRNTVTSPGEEVIPMG